MENFPNHCLEADSHIELANARRNTGESFSTYYHRMCSVARRAGINDASTVKYIRNGLNHNGLRNIIAGMKFNSCLELYAFLNRYEQNLPTRYEYRERTFNNPDNYTAPSTSAGNAVTVAVERPTTMRREIRCYNCNEVGHLSMNCPKPQRRIRCMKCQRSGHSSRDCTDTNYQRTVTAQPGNPFKKDQNSTKQFDNSSEANVRRISETSGDHLRVKSPPIENSREKHSNITKVLTVGTHRVTSFVDPGSDRSLVRISVAQLIGDVRSCSTLLLKGFGGGTFPANECVLTTVQVDQVKVQTTLYVVDDELLPEDVLLGKDILCRPDVRLVIESGTCVLQYVPVNINMTETENANFRELLNEFSDSFATNLAELGCAKTAEMSITLTNDTPINCRPYRIPFAKQQSLNAMIDELLELKIIRRSTSPFASPIVIVKKQNGEDRLCVDYRQLNAVTVKQPYPMPVVEEQLASLAGNAIFTSLDLVAGYHQIPIVETSKSYTAFVTHEGHYEFNRMPFGLVNAPSVFQTAINSVIQQLGRGEAVAYLDDVIIPSVDVDEGIRCLRKFLTALKLAGFTLRLSKCKFLADEVTFLGHRFNKDGMMPGDIKTAAIRMFPVPTNIHELRQFLGLTGFFRKFVSNYSTITLPFRPLLKTKNNPTYLWLPEHENAFETLKSCLVGAPTLALYDQTKKHEVHTDASATGLAAVLMQSDENIWRPVFYYSRHTNEAERNYHSYELEVLAIVEALERFKMYLLG